MDKRMWFACCLLTHVACSGAAEKTPNRPPACATVADWAQLEGIIAFESVVDDDMDVFVMSAPDWKPRRLTAAAGFDGHPDPAPDGRSLVFTSVREGNKNLYRYDLTNGRVTQLTSHPADEDYARWSPDSKRLAFVSRGDIHLMRADGTGRVALTRHVAQDEGVSWHPDGTRLAFTSLRDGEWETYTMSVDGTDVKRLTHNNFVDGHPHWSPDGRQIAFSAKRNGRWDVYAMKADGSGRRRITKNPGADWAQGWSPDGKWVLVASEFDGNWDVYAVRRDGTRRLRLTCEERTTRYPSWGKKAAD